MTADPFHPPCARCTSPRAAAVRVEAERRVYLCADCAEPDRLTLDDLCAAVAHGAVTGAAVVGLARQMRRGR